MVQGKRHSNSSRKLNQSLRPPHFYKLTTPSGLPTSHPQEVLNIFENFYSSLLAPTQTGPSAEGLAWFNFIPIPAVTTSQLDSFNSPISQSEVMAVIKALKTGSAPGPDGFSILYYKTISSQLSPRLVWIFNFVLQSNSFPEEMLANMSLIPKQNKDHTHPRNFRPISY